MLMTPDKPALGIRFDVNKVDSGYYGFDCWKIVWSALDPEMIENSELFEGDTNASMAGRENVYCIAIQNPDSSLLNTARHSLSVSEEFKRVAATPMFVEGYSATSESLVRAGRIDGVGNIVGESFIARPALKAVRPDLATADQQAEPAYDAVRIDEAAATASSQLKEGPVSMGESEKATGGLEDIVARKDFREMRDNYKHALRYLDNCGELTLDKLREAIRIGRVDISETELERQWQDSRFVLPSNEHPGGHEYIRFMLKSTLMEGIAVAEALLGKTETEELPNLKMTKEPSNKEPSKRKKGFWEFWK